MQLIKLIILVVCVERICSLKINNNVLKPQCSAELEDAAIQILTTCPATKTKTIALAGEFPENFLKRLWHFGSSALVTSDHIRRSSKNINHLRDINLKRTHKVDVFVAIAKNANQFHQSLYCLEYSIYDNPMALILAIIWSPKKNLSCPGNREIARFFHASKFQNHLKTVLICHDPSKGVMLYSYNPFTSKAPDPWQRVSFLYRAMGHNFTIFKQQYRDDEANCKNLDFDKTHDLGGYDMKLMLYMPRTMGNISSDIFDSPDREIMIERKLSTTYIYNFIAHVNATAKHVWEEATGRRDNELLIRQRFFMRLMPRSLESATYPHGQVCKYLISQFRGHKSQLQKILDVIDVYSWICLCLTYLVSLMFLKYFFRQPFISGILNLIRLTCNCGVITSSPKISSQIYMGCLLFVVVTMQGIFMGNLAALLTHDYPVRQVNSIQDLIDIRYTVYVHPADQALFNNPAFRGRIISRLPNDDCISKVEREPTSACLEWGASDKRYALGLKLHVSSGCISGGNLVQFHPKRWPLKERINEVLMWSLATDIMLPLRAIVAKERLLGEESQEVVLEPRIMVFHHLHFAFNILGIGLTCAFVCFIVELIVYRYKGRINVTRANGLNGFGNISIWILEIKERAGQRFEKIFR